MWPKKSEQGQVAGEEREEDKELREGGMQTLFFKSGIIYDHGVVGWE